MDSNRTSFQGGLFRIIAQTCALSKRNKNGCSSSVHGFQSPVLAGRFLIGHTFLLLCAVKSRQTSTIPKTRMPWLR